MKQVKCDRQCQSNLSGYCIGTPCFHGKVIALRSHVNTERLRKMGRHKSQPQKLNRPIFNQIRREKGFTVEQLANQIHYSYDAVAQWAWKGRPLRNDSIEALEQCLGVDRKVFLL